MKKIKKSKNQKCEKISECFFFSNFHLSYLNIFGKNSECFFFSIFHLSYLNIFGKNSSPLGYAARSGGSSMKYHSREMRINR